ncbi:hypothetical protein [Pseudomonas serbica]|uniref:hypothetical protein n=1 Tax=Pseudomonas serbica TaxID=2965074 RepID=UPI00237B4338|nr:hypothetical protein [Pseudomonas serbica]
MKSYFQADIGKCRVTGISGLKASTGARWFLGYSTNPCLSDQGDKPNKGRNRLADWCWRRVDGPWTLYGWVSPSRSRFFGFSLTLPGEAKASLKDYLVR